MQTVHKVLNGLRKTFLIFGIGTRFLVRNIYAGAAKDTQLAGLKYNGPGSANDFEALNDLSGVAVSREGAVNHRQDTGIGLQHDNSNVLTAKRCVNPSQGTRN